MHQESQHPNARPFAYWLLGYQGFYEPIIHEWFLEQGYPSVNPRSVVGRALLPSLHHIQNAGSFSRVPENRRNWAVSELSRKSETRGGRVQLDLLLESNGGLITGECKSWGGFSGPVTWQVVETVFVSNNDGLFLYLTTIDGQPVVESRLVLWKRSGQHEEIEKRMTDLFERPVRLHYIDEILASVGPEATKVVNDRLLLLDEAVEIVRRMLRGQ